MLPRAMPVSSCMHKSSNERPVINVLRKTPRDQAGSRGVNQGKSKIYPEIWY